MEPGVARTLHGCGLTLTAKRTIMPNHWTGKGNPYTRTEVLDRLYATLRKGEPIIAAARAPGSAPSSSRRAGRI